MYEEGVSFVAGPAVEAEWCAAFRAIHFFSPVLDLACPVGGEAMHDTCYRHAWLRFMWSILTDLGGEGKCLKVFWAG